MNDITSHVTPKDDQTPPKTPENPDKKKRKQSTPKRVTRKQANALVIDSDIAIQDALAQLQNVQELAAKAGLSVECNTLPRITVTGILSDHTSNPIDSLGMPNDLQSHVAQLTTGGHFNTDHTIVRTGDERIDRVAELRRNLWRRHRLTQPEERQEGRWDRPRLPGERRRRVVRERDLPDAPPEPPLSGYIAFLGQMTVKLRHDRPDMPHDQTKGTNLSSITSFSLLFALMNWFPKSILAYPCCLIYCYCM